MSIIIAKRSSANISSKKNQQPKGSACVYICSIHRNNENREQSLTTLASWIVVNSIDHFLTALHLRATELQSAKVFVEKVE